MQNHPVIFFDGECNLCNGAVQFIIRHDRQQRFRFASLQGNFGRQTIPSSGEMNTLYLLENKVLYSRSTAVLRIARQLDGLYKLAYFFIVVPRFLRDAVYNLVARNRYKWFGRQESCAIPTPELNRLFIS
jgi:predicted DCC family thiol-disulfide oxidoreductase YuxK